MLYLMMLVCGRVLCFVLFVLSCIVVRLAVCYNLGLLYMDFVVLYDFVYLDLLVISVLC